MSLVDVCGIGSAMLCSSRLESSVHQPVRFQRIPIVRIVTQCEFPAAGVGMAGNTHMVQHMAFCELAHEFG
jgi:hypothetical protein